MDSVKIGILLLMTLSAVSAVSVLREEDDVATPDGQVHEVAQSDPECNWQEINSTTADGKTTTVFMDFEERKLLFLNGSTCEVRTMTDKDMAIQEHCNGEELSSEDDGEEQSEADSEDFEEDDSSAVDLKSLPDRMQKYCSGKDIRLMVAVASGGTRDKRSYRCYYRCLTYRRCYRYPIGWTYRIRCYYYRRCYRLCY